MGAVTAMKRLVGIGDDIATLSKQIEELKAEAAAALNEAARLVEARLTAPNFEEAEQLERKAAAAKWTADNKVARLPDLEARLADAKAKKLAEALERHKTRHAALYRKLRVAVEAAATVNAETIAADRDACAELGEHLARRHLPVITFRGLLFADLIELWTNEMGRVMGAPKRPISAADAISAAKLRPKPTVTPSQPPQANPAAIVLKAPRTPDDLTPLEPDQVRVRVLRDGYSPSDTSPQCYSGQLIRMPRVSAERVITAGAIEIVEEPPAKTGNVAARGTP